MACTTEQSISPMINDLLAHGHEFSFPQVMRIARMHLGAGGAGELPEIPWQERLRVRPDLSLAFPAADVARVERTGQDGDDLLITTTFLGLYGSSSPLPNHYTEDLMDEAGADSSVSRDFLDILHQRLYQLYFQCWSKYRLFVRVAEEQNPRDRERLFCLIGLGEKELRDSVPGAWSLVRYAGLFTQFPRSAEGLQTLLRDALGVRKLEVEQCILRRVPIPADQQIRLGISGMCLGMNSVLGSEIPDRMGKFRIHLGPFSKREYDTFLPGTPSHHKLASLIRLYILDPFEFDLQITLAAREAKPIRLGDPDGAKLGWNSWCFAGATMEETSALFPIEHSAAPTPSPAAEEPEAKEPSSLIDYYQQELSKLRDLAAGYAASHPELASMISGRLADPGVERLFEGVAFLNANLQQKLDDDFPEVIHDVIDAIQPNYLRPIPATTIIVFSPKPNCTTTQTIPVGTELKSIPVDGTACTFTTRYPVEIHPLTLIEAAFAQPSGKPAAITLRLKLSNIPLADWNLKSLRFFLAGESAQASNLYLVLMRYVKRIVISPIKGGQSITLDATHLKAVGFEDTEALFPGDDSRSSNQQFMHEYFIQPDKFMFVDLLGWEKWSERGEGTEFEVRFELDKLPFELHRVSKGDFALFATPAVNVFAHRAEPITTDSQHSEYQVRPADGVFGHYDIYSIERVSGLLNNTNHKMSFISAQQGNQRPLTVPIYHVKRRKAVILTGLDAFISIEIPQKTISKKINSLIVEIACTNGKRPEKLQVGDICKDTDNSPSFADFANCKPFTRFECINRGSNTLWRLYSHYNLNISLLNVTSLRAMLELVSQSYNHDHTSAKLHSNRIQGIVDLQIKPADRLAGRAMLRGWEIGIQLNPDFYDSPGDLYLFGALLDHFLRGFATQSCFTHTTIEEDQDGERYDWPVNMGRRRIV